MADEPKFHSLTPLCGAAEAKSAEGSPAAIGAFNINFYSQAVGVLKGLQKADAPAIIQASKGANSFQGGPDKIAGMPKLAMKNLGHTLPICLHLDHGDEDDRGDGGHASDPDPDHVVTRVVFHAGR